MRVRNRYAAALTAVVSMLCVQSANADFALNMTPGVTETSHSVYGLHMTILAICAVIGVVVFGMMIISIIRHRKSKGAVAAQFHESTTAEIAWTIVPIIILVSMAIPATHALLAMEDTADADMTIKITGIQWKWKYDYVEDQISIISTLDPKHNAARELGSNVDVSTIDHYLLDVDKPLVVPVGKKIRFLVTAADVIHSWWVPNLGWKKDAIPGYINEAWTKVEKPGIYRGQCAELCGKDHGFMPIVVKAVPQDEYVKWVASQKQTASAAADSADRVWDKDELMKRGAEVYGGTCAACHQANGEGVPGTFPSLKGSAIVNNEDPNVHIQFVLNGKSGTAMAAYRDLMNDSDLAAVLTYERNSWGNDAGVIQPAAVKADR